MNEENQEIEEPCEGCRGKGWAVFFRQDDDRYEIEKCDNCGIFQYDEDAQEHVLAQISCSPEIMNALRIILGNGDILFQ